MRIDLPQRLAVGLSISQREAILAIPVPEADAYPGFGDRIIDLKQRLRAARGDASRAGQKNFAAVELAKRAAARLADLYRQRDELAAQYPALAMRYAKDESDADTLNGHHREIARLDLQIRALTVAVPLFDGEARRIMQGNEVLARRPDDIAVELNNLRAEAAAEIARSRW